MSYVGDFRLGDTFDIKFTTRQISGAPSTLSSSPVISAYVGNSTTELTAGITLTVDFDSRTGLNNVRVVATSGNGYATASNYQLVITTGTVNSVSVVGEVIAEFSIEARSALMPTTAARTLVVDAAGLADANTVKVGPTGSGTAQTARDVGLALPAVAAGAANGLLISGSNSGTTTFGALTVTGATTLSGAVAFQSTLAVTGTTTLTGNVSLGGTLGVTGTTTFAAINTGTITTTGNWAVSGTATVTGGIVANITGNLSGSIGSYTGNTPQTGDAFARIGAAGAGLTAITGATLSAAYDAAKTASSASAVAAVAAQLPAALTSGGMIKADILYVNGHAVAGDGHTGTEWGPA